MHDLKDKKKGANIHTTEIPGLGERKMPPNVNNPTLLILTSIRAAFQNPHITIQAMTLKTNCNNKVIRQIYHG